MAMKQKGGGEEICKVSIAVFTSVVLYSNFKLTLSYINVFQMAIIDFLGTY